MKQQKRSLIAFLGRHRRWVILGGIGTVLAVIAGYGVWSKNIWEGYEAHYSQWQDSTKSRLHEVLAQQSDTTEEHAAKLAGLKEVANTIAGGENVCNVTALVAWQRSLFNLREREEQCYGAKNALDAFKGRLEEAIVYLQDEEALSKALAAVPHPDKPIEEKDWATYVAGWHTALDAAKALTVSGAFDPVKQKAIETIGVTTAAWEEVVAASQAKDKPRYIKAQQALADSYNGFSQLTALTTQQIQPLSSAVDTTYKAASL